MEFFIPFDTHRYLHYYKRKSVWINFCFSIMIALAGGYGIAILDSNFVVTLFLMTILEGILVFLGFYSRWEFKGIIGARILGIVFLCILGGANFSPYPLAKEFLSSFILGIAICFMVVIMLSALSNNKNIWFKRWIIRGYLLILKGYSKLRYRKCL